MVPSHFWGCPIFHNHNHVYSCTGSGCLTPPTWCGLGVGHATKKQSLHGGKGAGATPFKSWAKAEASRPKRKTLRHLDVPFQGKQPVAECGNPRPRQLIGNAEVPSHIALPEFLEFALHCLHSPLWGGQWNRCLVGNIVRHFRDLHFHPSKERQTRITQATHPGVGGVSIWHTGSTEVKSKRPVTNAARRTRPPAARPPRL